jgi:hypothetical protein
LLNVGLSKNGATYSTRTSIGISVVAVVVVVAAAAAAAAAETLIGINDADSKQCDDLEVEASTRLLVDEEDNDNIVDEDEKGERSSLKFLGSYDCRSSAIVAMFTVGVKFSLLTTRVNGKSSKRHDGTTFEKSQ